MLEVTVDVLRKIPVLKNLTEAELDRLLADPYNSVQSYGPHVPIFAENDPADCMYLVLEGTVDVRINMMEGRELTIALLNEGEYFGEQALLPGSNGRRNASVRTLSACKLMRIAGEYVAASTTKSDEFLRSGQTHEADVDDRARQVLRTVRLFRSLSERDLDRINEWTKVVRFAAGDMIFREGDPGECLYVVMEGSLEMFVMDDDGKLVVLSRIGKGQYVGEQALLPDGGTHHDFNVRAESNATLLRIHRRHVQAILRHDVKLLAALRAMGEAQSRKRREAIGRGDDW